MVNNLFLELSLSVLLVELEPSLRPHPSRVDSIAVALEIPGGISDSDRGNTTLRSSCRSRLSMKLQQLAAF